MLHACARKLSPRDASINGAWRPVSLDPEGHGSWAGGYHARTSCVAPAASQSHARLAVRSLRAAVGWSRSGQAYEMGLMGLMESADRQIEVRPCLLDSLACIEAAVGHWRVHTEALAAQCGKQGQRPLSRRYDPGAAARMVRSVPNTHRSTPPRPSEHNVAPYAAQGASVLCMGTQDRDTSASQARGQAATDLRP